MNYFIKIFLSSGKPLAQYLKKFNKDNGDGEYLKYITSSALWKNDFKSSVACTAVYHHVHDFLDACEIRDGKAYAPDGKLRKVLFLGYDGLRADAALKIVKSENIYDKTLSHIPITRSGISQIAASGGLYLSFCGGFADKPNRQSTSTSAGWTSQFTGVWGIDNGIKENNHTKNMKYKTFFLEYAQKGLAASVNFDWTPFFRDNLRPEVEYAMKHRDLKLKFIDTSIDYKPNLNDIEKFTSYVIPRDSILGDKLCRDCTLWRINEGDSIVGAIYDAIDTAGHAFDFDKDNINYINSALISDMYTTQILQAISEREQTLNEKWLVILANDHGGLGKGHGGQSLAERTTWISTNVEIDKKYYLKNYNGHNDDSITRI